MDVLPGVDNCTVFISNNLNGVSMPMPSGGTLDVNVMNPRLINFKVIYDPLAPPFLYRCSVHSYMENPSLKTLTIKPLYLEQVSLTAVSESYNFLFRRLKYANVPLGLKVIIHDTAHTVLFGRFCPVTCERLNTLT